MVDMACSQCPSCKPNHCVITLPSSMPASEHFMKNKQAMSHIQDMAKRRERKEFEMLWRGARSFGSEADVFTSNWPTGGDWPHRSLSRT